MGREGTWSGNASLPLQPATSYHGASSDRWMQESPIIEMLGHKRPDEGEELPHASWCVRMSGGSQGSAVLTTATHLRDCRKNTEHQGKNLYEVWFISVRLVNFVLQYCYHGNLYLDHDLSSKMANFLSFCFVSKRVADATAKGHKQSVPKITFDVRAVDKAKNDQNDFGPPTAFRRFHEHTACCIDDNKTLSNIDWYLDIDLGKEWMGLPGTGPRGRLGLDLQLKGLITYFLAQNIFVF